MRVRTVNEKAVAKTLSFLKDIHFISDSPVIKPLSLLYVEHGISKSTGTACKQLGLFEANENGTYKWLSTVPDRAMAIKVLELLRRRNDKMVAVPLEGFEQLLMDLKEIVKQSKPQNNSSPKGDKKHDDFIKIVAGLCAAYPIDSISKEPDTFRKTRIDNLNKTTLDVAQDLLTKIYNK